MDFTDLRATLTVCTRVSPPANTESIVKDRPENYFVPDPVEDPFADAENGADNSTQFDEETASPALND